MHDIEEGPSVKHSKGPPTLTLYPASIVKGHGANDVGIYFPEAYQPSGTLDLLVYFHGLPTPCKGHDSDKIADIWRNPFFPLRERVNDSKKNVVLVAPRLKAGKGLELGMDADDFLRKIVDIIAKRVTKDPFTWHGAAPPDAQKVDPVIKIGKLILAAHSGGGTPMRKMAQALVNSKLATVRECWGFDSMYNGPREWVEWAAVGGKYFLFYTDQGSIDTRHYGYNVTAIQKILAKATAKATAPTAAGGGTTVKVRHHTKTLKKEIEEIALAVKQEIDEVALIALASLAARNITVTYANAPDDASKGFVPTGGRTFKQKTPAHCEVPRTYWVEMMGSF